MAKSSLKRMKFLFEKEIQGCIRLGNSKYNVKNDKKFITNILK